MGNTPNAGDGDKRSVSTDALETLGMIHFRTEHRDAIHLAVEPVVAGMILNPSDRIAFDIDHKVYRERDDLEAIGIVDPFLDGPVQPGQSFWLVVFPRKITSLRHVWSHPLFPEAPRAPLTEDEKRQVAALINDPYHQSMSWLENYLSELNQLIEDDSGIYGGAPDLLTMDEFLDIAQRNAEGHDDFLSRGGAFEGHSLPREFWEHFERVRHIQVPQGNRNSFFSCSC